MLFAQPDDPPPGDGGGLNLGDLLPDDAPPWLVALAIVATFLLVTSLYWGPAVGALLRGPVPSPGAHARPVENDDDPAGEHGQTVPVRAPAAERVDGGMAVIQQMVEQQAERLRVLDARSDEREAELSRVREQLREATAQLQDTTREAEQLRLELAAARAESQTLRRYVDQLLDHRPGGGQQ